MFENREGQRIPQASFRTRTEGGDWKTLCQLAAPLVVRYSLKRVRWKNVKPAGSAEARGVASAVLKYVSAGLKNSAIPL